MKIFNWLRWLWPIKTVYINGKKDRIAAFALNFAAYFLLLNLYWWIAGIDPVRTFYIGPMESSIRQQLIIHAIERQKLYEAFYVLKSEELTRPLVKDYLDRLSELVEKEDELKWWLYKYGFKIESRSAIAEADVVDRVIHAGDTPLASTCTVTQTGPMELTVSACSFTTTGQARIVAKEKVSDLPTEIAAGRAMMMPDNKRVRGWLRDKDGNIIDKSKTHTAAASTALTITAGDTWVIYLTDGPGITMPVVLQKAADPRPANFVEFIIMPFTVPAGTTDLSTIDIEVFTVKPDFPPPRPLFER